MTTAGETVYGEIRRRIADGVYAPGSRLAEEAVAEDVGFSRTPVREALRRLAKEGLIELSPNRTAVVAKWTWKELGDLFECRALLEAHAAGLAATCINSEQLDRLAELAEEMATLSRNPTQDRLETIANLNLDFHKSVARASGNGVLVDLMSRLVEMPLVLRTFQRYTPAYLERSMSHHRELVTALAARDAAWAEAVMRAHVLAGRSVMVETWISRQGSR